MNGRSQLDCIHRGDRLEHRGTCAEGCRAGTKIPLSQCNYFGAPCSVAVKTQEGHHLCKTCPERKPPETVRPEVAPEPRPVPAPHVTVPEPPPLDLTPMRSRAVVTVAVDEPGRSLLSVTGPHMRAYAERVDADLVVLDWPGHPDWVMSAKYAIPRVLDHYDRIAYFDADVLLRPGCVDLFSLCEPHEFGACDELPFHRANPNHKRESLYRELRKRFGFKESPIPFYFNLGVFVAPKSAAPLLMPPFQPIEAVHCSEQDHSNARILDAFNAGHLKLRLLDRRANWQNWTDWGFKEATADAVLHFSGGGPERSKRAARIRDFAARYPLMLSASSPWLPYLICSTQRSGSTLLAKALEDAGLGRPGELLSTEDPAPKTLEAIRENGCAKVHWFQLEKNGLTEEPAIPGAKYISVSRRDPIRQAVSLLRALQTKQWTSERKVFGEPSYDRARILECMARNAADSAGWEGYFAKHQIQPLRVYYEDFAADFGGTVRKVLDYLGEYSRPVPEPRLRKQADELNDEWAERFLRGE